MVREYRCRANNAPFAPSTLQGLVVAVQDDQQANGVPFSGQEVRDRALKVLTAFPDDPEIWHLAIDMISVFGTAPGQDEMQRLELAEPYFENAIAYSLHDTSELAAAVDLKLRLLVQRWIIDSAEPVPPKAVPPEVETDLICPTIRQQRLLAEICFATQMASNGCGSWEAVTSNHLKLDEFAKAGHCVAEYSPRSLSDLGYSPVPVDLTAQN